MVYGTSNHPSDSIGHMAARRLAFKALIRID
jgi:hypothetical protein